MASIALNVSTKNVLQKLQKGQDVITKSTANPLVPGNGASVATFTAAQTALLEASDADTGARSTVKDKAAQLKDAEMVWVSAFGGLAGMTMDITQGDASAMVSAGFDIRLGPTAPQPLPAPTKVVANLNGTPGHTLLSWEVIAGAKSYVIQISPDPMTGTSWTYACACTTANADVNGAEPGKRYWYRIAAVNAKGQGPWSEPVCRPVM